MSPCRAKFIWSSQPTPIVCLDMGALMLVTSEDCHFCERAHVILDSLGVEARTVDVRSERAAELARSGIPLTVLPVLTDGKAVIAYGRFSEKHLRRRLGIGAAR